MLHCIYSTPVLYTLKGQFENKHSLINSFIHSILSVSKILSSIVYHYNRGLCNTLDYNLSMCSNYLLYTVAASVHIYL